MKVLLGIIGGGVGGFLLSRYAFPPPVMVGCGSGQLMIYPNGSVVLPNGITVPISTACGVLQAF